MNILNQRDPKWKNIKLGFGNTTIGDYGCTITALAMLYDTTPDVVNEKLKAVGGFTGPNQNLLIWEKIKSAYPNTESVERVRTYDNNRVSEAINNYGGCLVEVDFDNTARTDGKHWVLLVGNKRLYDPWTGKERPTSDYSIYTGFTVIKFNQTKGEEMSGCLLPNTEENRKTWEKLVSNSGKYDEFVKQGFSNPEDVKTKIAQFEQQVKGRDETLNSLNQVVSDKNDKISVQQSQISSLESRLLEATTRIESLTEQAKKLPQIKEEYEYLLEEREKWQKAEQTYNRTIGQLKRENSELKANALKALFKKAFEFISNIKNKINGNKEKNG